MPSILSGQQRADFDRDGYVIVRAVFDDQETALLRTAMETDPMIAGNLYDRGDSEGAATKMAAWKPSGR